MPVKHISYSYLHLFACPYAAFLRYEAEIRAPMNEYLALGNALHLAIELGHVNGTFDVNEAHRIFLREFNEFITEEDIFINYPKKVKMESEGSEMISLYGRQVESGKLDPNPFGLEVEFSIPFEDTVVVGRIDKVEYSPETGYIITDFKSGGKEPDEWFLDHNLQFTAYAWACQQLYGELPRKLQWHHLRTGKLLETHRTQRDIDELKRMISNAIKMNKQDIRYRVYHEQICKWCDYQGAICDDRDLEEQVVNARK